MNAPDKNMPMNTALTIAAVVGVVAFLLLMMVGGFGFFGGLFLGLLLAIVVFVLLLVGFVGDAGGMMGVGPAAGGTGANAGAAIARDVAQAKPKAATVVDKTPDPTPAAKAAAPVEAKPAVVAKPKPTGVKATKALAGQAELASGKGDWKYQGAGKPARAKAAKPAKAKAVKPAKAKPAKAPEPAAAPAGDVLGSKPATLKAARKGGADDLKLIKGVGPKMETMLNAMGFYHFDQVATWSADELAWVDQNLKGFKGRASRDGWIAQAKILATGGETEFSKKSGKGGVNQG